MFSKVPGGCRSAALPRAPGPRAVLGTGGARAEAYLHARGRETLSLLIPGAFTPRFNKSNVSGINGDMLTSPFWTFLLYSKEKANMDGGLLRL